MIIYIYITTYFECSLWGFSRLLTNAVNSLFIPVSPSEVAAGEDIIFSWFCLVLWTEQNALFFIFLHLLCSAVERKEKTGFPCFTKKTHFLCPEDKAKPINHCKNSLSIVALKLIFLIPADRFLVFEIFPDQLG